MVKETRIVFGLEDIQAVRFTCTNPNCRKDIGHKLSQGVSVLPARCPWCQHGWSPNDDSVRAVNTLLEILAKLPKSEGKVVEVSLELDGEES